MQVHVPQLGESITTAVVARWLKQVGQEVSKDEPILELETDKVTVEVPAPQSGVLSHVDVKEGDEISVGDVICSIGQSDNVSPVSNHSGEKHGEEEKTSQEEQQYDVVVIGGGPGGYCCAIRAAQLGFKVAVVEEKALGGTCLNVGCIPSKALLQASENYYEISHEFVKQGIEISSATMNLDKLQSHKRDIIQSNVAGINYLFKKNSIELIKGRGTILASGVVEVGEKIITTKNIVIATGSYSATLPNVEIDEQHIVSSTGALDFTEVPKKLAVIGGGVIGVELGSVWHRLGAEVTIIEYLPHLLGQTDRQIEKEFKKIFTKQGFVVKTNEKVTSCRVQDGKVQIDMVSRVSGEEDHLEFDKALVAVGRRANSDRLGLDTLGVEKDKRGFVKVDDHFSTNIAGIYAIGDVIGGALLAHKATEEGVALAEILAGQSPMIDYNAIPAVIYTSPEVASVGMTEEELKEKEIPYHIGKFPFMANGRAKTMGMTQGFVKILAQPHSDRVLGVHILGPCAGELIAEATMAIEFGASSEDIARICHAHPTLSEAVKEAALDVDKRALHI